jgi:hypothetical protein
MRYHDSEQSSGNEGEYERIPEDRAAYNIIGQEDGSIDADRERTFAVIKE